MKSAVVVFPGINRERDMARALRLISGRLLGTLDIIPSPAEIAADFRHVLETALSKSVADVALRLAGILEP